MSAETEMGISPGLVELRSKFHKAADRMSTLIDEAEETSGELQDAAEIVDASLDALDKLLKPYDAVDGRFARVRDVEEVKQALDDAKVAVDTLLEMGAARVESKERPIASIRPEPTDG